MNTKSKNFIKGMSGLHWAALGWSILAMVGACILLCLLDIPHWPMWR